jgi:hypothetical protein
MIKKYALWLADMDNPPNPALCDVKLLKDETTGKARFIKLVWDQHSDWDRRRQRRTNKRFKTVTVEIPYWNWTCDVIEETLPEGSDLL